MVISSIILGLDGNIYFDGWGNIGHISFLESVGGRDRVIEPIYMP
jgi:hypothetical protein